MSSRVDADHRRELRESIARDLHDGPIRELTACIVRLENFRSVSDNPHMQMAISAIEEHARAALMSMRNLIRDLRYEAPREDLPDAIQAMIERFRKSSAAEFTLVVSPDWPLLIPASVELDLLRIVQEAAHNAVRHGAAQQILVELRTRPGRLKVTVSDDGDGIIPGTPEGGGMIGMRERVALIGGRLEVRHRPRGTVIDVEVPSA
ncbi:MAG TPA: ATP-binding protein [Candidatus Dormibacteraeota bacterium]|nr:ATP-binding protein [Candidatus Dormibacteraeota bacterium]